MKSYNKSSYLFLGGYYLVKLLFWTKKISLCEKDGKFTRFKGNDIENIINTKKTMINIELYQNAKKELAEAKN